MYNGLDWNMIPSTLTSPRFSELTAKLDHLGWPVIQEQSITDLLFLVWKMSFRSFFRINLDPLNIIIHCPSTTIPRVVSLIIYFESKWFCGVFIELFNCISLYCNILTELNHDFYWTEIFFKHRKYFWYFYHKICRKNIKAEQPEAGNNI